MIIYFPFCSYFYDDIFLDQKISGRAFLDIKEDQCEGSKISFGGLHTLCPLQKEVKGTVI